MFGMFRRDPSFSVAADTEPSDVLIAGLTNSGLAGLTAADYLVDHLELEEHGHVRTAGMPSITPFEEGRPRHPMRLFSREDLDVTILTGELFVPPALSEAFVDEVLEWTGEGDVEEIAMLAGVPVPHGPGEHRTYYVATDDYRERRLADDPVEPMGTGFLDGVNAALVERGMESPLGIGVYVTPVHAQAPDVEAAIRLVEAVETVYDLGVDAGPLEAFAAEIRKYYADLAERMEERERETPADRMYM